MIVLLMFTNSKQILVKKILKVEQHIEDHEEWNVTEFLLFTWKWHFECGLQGGSQAKLNPKTR